jgi:hypothetical protein
MITTTFTIKRNRRLALKSDNTETVCMIVTYVAKWRNRMNQNCSIIYYLSDTLLSYSQTFNYYVLTEAFVMPVLVM